MSQNSSRYILFAILSSCLSSTSTLFKVQGVAVIDPVLAATVGVLFAGIISWSYLIIRKQIPKWQNIRQVIIPLCKLTLCRPVVSNILFTIGLSMSSGIKAVILTKMEPYLVIFWVWVLDGKRPSNKHLLLLVIHILGAALLSMGEVTMVSGVDFGDLIIIIAVITAGLSYRYAPQVTKFLTPVQTSTITETAGGLLTAPLALFFCPLIFTADHLAGWGYIGIHAIMFYVIAIPLLYASLQGLDGWKSSALRATGPLIAVPIAWVFFGERLGFWQIIGALIVIITSGLVSRAEKKKEQVLELD